MIDVLKHGFKQIDGPTPDDPVTYEPWPGWRVNVTTEILAAHPVLDAYRVTPPALYQIFAGDNRHSPGWTVPLRFADEAGGRAVLEAEGLLEG